MDKYKTVEQIRKEYQDVKKELWLYKIIALLDNEHGITFPCSNNNLINSFWQNRVYTYYEAGVDDRYATSEIAKELKSRFR